MRKRGRPPHPDILTPREWQVLDLLRQGLTNERIAERLDISFATAKYHVAEIISKLGVQTREEAAAWQPEAVAVRWWQRAGAWVPRHAWPLAGAAGALAALAGLTWLVLDRSAGEDNSASLSQPTTSPQATQSTAPAPTATFLSTSTGWQDNPRAGRRIAFLDSQHGLWVARADGGERRSITMQPCPEGTEHLGPTFDWSPDGRMVSMLCSDVRGIDLDVARRVLQVWSLDVGLVATIEGVAHYAWAPDSRRIAYQTAESLRSSPSANIRLFELDTSTDSPLFENAVLLSWPEDARILVGLNPRENGLSVFGAFEGAWLNAEAGQTETIAYFNNRRQFWIAPNRAKTVALAKNADRPEGGAVLAVYDFLTGEERIIEGSAIAYPSEGIPSSRLAVSPESDEFYWVDWASEEVVYRANTDASNLTRVGPLPGFLVALSGDGLVAYSPSNQPGVLIVRDLNTAAETEISDRRVASWAPAGPRPHRSVASRT